MMRLRIGQELEDRQRGHGFSGTGFTDQRHGFAGCDIERHTIDRERLPRTGADGDGAIADREEGLSHRNVFRGSKASSTPSPMKINSDNISATVKKPVRPSHGACTLAL